MDRLVSENDGTSMKNATSLLQWNCEMQNIPT